MDSVTFGEFIRKKRTALGLPIREVAGQVGLDQSLLSNIEWRKVIAFRHILVHDYYKVNTRIVWNAIESKLPDMKLEIVQMLEEE
jgi:predicted transcriptional regulator